MINQSEHIYVAHCVICCKWIKRHALGY